MDVSTHQAFAKLDKRGDGKITGAEMLNAIAECGLRPHDVRVKETCDLLRETKDVTLQDFEQILHSNMVVDRALTGKMIIPDFPKFSEHLVKLYDETKPFDGGKNADYIPQLSEAYVNPHQWGVSVCTVDGQIFAHGDIQQSFCIQSCSKPITYALGLQHFGEDKVHKHVGREPSGKRFNELTLDPLNRPHNPCINAGAMMCCSFIKPEGSMSEKFDHVMNAWRDLSGGHRPGFANSTYLSEAATADRNFCLGYMMKEKGTFPEWIQSAQDLERCLNFYFMCCSIEQTCESMSIVAGTLANNGICPTTGQKVLDSWVVRNTLAVMYSCGMYDYSGEFAFRIGCPAKSGVGGSVITIVPGVLGLCTFSPRLHVDGNSVRGTTFCRLLMRDFAFHDYDSLTTKALGSEHKEDPRRQDRKDGTALGGELLYAAAGGKIFHVRRLVAGGVDVNYADYDARTSLHLAASEGHADICTYLILHGAKTDKKDRFGNVALDDAKRHAHAACQEILQNPPKPTKVLTPTNEVEACFWALDDEADGNIPIKRVNHSLTSCGYHIDDPRVDKVKSAPENLDLAAFTALAKDCPELLLSINRNVVVPAFTDTKVHFEKIFNSIKQVNRGSKCTRIPQLRDANADHFALSVATVSGQHFELGDANVRFPVESAHMPITYCIAATECIGKGEDIHDKVGFEPNGGSIDEVSLDYGNKAHNPLINTGALVSCSLIKPEENLDARFDHVMSVWRKLLGGKAPTFDNSVYLNEIDSNDRNLCLAYMMKEEGALPSHVKDADSLMTQLKLMAQCGSISTTTSELALVASALANGGVCPTTGEEVFKPNVVRNVLSLMFSCGMSNFSGEWGFATGFPAMGSKSGVIMMVIPNVMGIAVYSPNCDSIEGSLCGVSARGLDFARKVVQDFSLHHYDSFVGLLDVRQPLLASDIADLDDLLHAAGGGDVRFIQTLRARRVDLGAADYDGRTALHLASAEGHLPVVRYLVEQGVDHSPRDRWENTPLSDAKPEVAEYLRSQGAR